MSLVRDLAADPGAEEIGDGDGEALPERHEPVEAAGILVDGRWTPGHEIPEDPRQRVGRGAPLALELERPRVAERPPEIERAIALRAAEADHFPVEDEVRAHH